VSSERPLSDSTTRESLPDTVSSDTREPLPDAIPSGTRDVLPDEMRELRALQDRLRGVFERAGYGEVYTPALEYESPLVPTREHPEWSGPRPAYRVFDEHGNVLALRSDMTVPIARLVATRYRQADPPLRFCYFAHAYRGVRPQRGQSRELLQAGIELIGADGPEGTAEVLTVLCDALDAAGLRSYRVGLGDASLYPALLETAGVPDGPRERMLAQLVAGDFVGLRRELDVQRLPQRQRELLLSVARTRGGPEVLEGHAGPLEHAIAGLRALCGLLPPQAAHRIIFDLGLVRNLGYYTGAVFQVYDPAHGVPIGQGGRYDELLKRFGRPLPAVGFALGVERVHIALAGEERGLGTRSPA
jgi:ATP phosphoribosyltransferase regulatory subunit